MLGSKVSSIYIEFGGIILSLFAFFVLLKGDPFGLMEVSNSPEHTAFFVSIIVLLLTEKLASIQRKVENDEIGNNIVNMVKSSHSVIQFRDPRSAIQYITIQLPELRDVESLSLNLSEELEHVDSQLYGAKEYDEFLKEIPLCVIQGLRWRDIGDKFAKKRFDNIISSIDGTESKGVYKYRFISHEEPQMTFIVLKYKTGGTDEVLFNWDYRVAGVEPVVMLSRDERIIRMFSVHFDNLWHVAS